MFLCAVADVIYGEVGAPLSSGKPISVKGKDGYVQLILLLKLLSYELSRLYRILAKAGAFIRPKRIQGN